MSRVLAGKTSELPPGKLHKVSINEKDILIVNLDGNFFAVDDTCTHSGASLSDGTLEGQTVTCGWHGAQFDCKTGTLAKFPAKINNIKSYNVIVESDEVFLEE